MPRYFEDLEVGDGFETPGRTITEADVVSYGAISGEQDVLDFTDRQSEGRPVVPELLIMVMSSGLGFRAPAETPQVLAFMVLDLAIRRPVRVGDTIRCRVRSPPWPSSASAGGSRGRSRSATPSRSA